MIAKPILAVLMPSGAVIAFLFFYPSFIPIKGGRKSSKQVNELRLRQEAAQKKHFVEPILLAIRTNRPERVTSLWNVYLAGGNPEDPWLRFQTAKYWASLGRTQEAKAQLEPIFHPPTGSWSTLQTSGEAVSLWLDVSGATPEQLKQMLSEWAAAHPKKEVWIAPGANVEAMAEYQAGQELLTFGRNKEALRHYERAAQLAPDSPFVFEALCNGCFSVGDVKLARQAARRAYWLAPPKDRLHYVLVGHMGIDEVGARPSWAEPDRSGATE